MGISTLLDDRINRLGFLSVIVTFLLLIFPGQNVMSQESSSVLPKITPVAIETSFLEGRGLTKVDMSEFDGENVTLEEDYTAADSKKHDFHVGKILVAVYEAGPGKVYIDGAVYDEFVQILEGRLILTPDGGDPVEFKQGDSLVVPQGYKGYWHMPEKYRELIIINTDYGQSEDGS